MVEVILREDVRYVGRAGELVRVKPGYARNYLLPQGLAYEATAGNKKRIEAESKARNVRLESEKDGALEMAQRLSSLEISIVGKAGEGDRLFGSITSQDLARELADQGVTVDKRKIELDHPIKTLGEHTVPIRLHPEVQADLRVKVVQE